MPPPSTRSSSGTPVGFALLMVELTWVSGMAGELGTSAVAARAALAPGRLVTGVRAGAASSTEPHSPHSGHRPTHFATVYRQAVQR
ncbi:conserved hypothetical protein [Rhodococcus sp. RD6.2]|nr:conserved hypothetical protein [Rhodococcus sp. RD6.2]